MLLFDQRDRFHTAGDYFTTDGCAGNRGAWEGDFGQYDQPVYVFSACGGSAVYRRSMLREIGTLDNDFFFLLEDVDLAWRAQLAGYKVWYTPCAVVYHHLSATGGGETASYYDGRNSIWVIVKNMPAGLLRKYARTNHETANNAILECAESLARARGARSTSRDARRSVDHAQGAQKTEGWCKR